MKKLVSITISVGGILTVKTFVSNDVANFVVIVISIAAAIGLILWLRHRIVKTAVDSIGKLPKPDS